MFKCKRLMVGLDFTLLDRMLIAYTGFLSRQLNIERVYFINVQKSFDVPPTVLTDFPELRVPQDELLVQRMREEVSAHFGNLGETEVDYLVVEGSPLKKINHWAKVKQIDLLIIGRKKELKGKGILPSQLLRSVSCCVLFIPEEVRQRLTEIMVQIDFSEASKKAMEVATYLGFNNPDVTVHCQHIYHLPVGYYFTEKGKEEVNRVIRAYHVMQYNQFIDTIPIEAVHINPIFTLDEDGDWAQTAYRTAQKKDVDLIVLGATGKTLFDSLVLGSFTEKMVQVNAQIPMLVVKQRQ